MRILVISDLPHFVTGGAEMQAARLIERWMDRGHEVICLGRRMGKGPVSIGCHQVRAHRIHSIPTYGRAIRGLSYWLSLTNLLLRYRRWADVIYTRFLGEAAITASLLKRFQLLRVPLVATPAGTQSQGDVHFLSTIPGTSWLIRLLDAECDSINLISPRMDIELHSAGFSQRNFTHIPNGVPIGSPSQQRGDGKIQFISVGRIAPEKGLDLLLEAVASLKAQLVPGQVVIVGSGPEESALRAQAKKLGINALLEWTGELDQSQVRTRLERADVFLLPSRWEGLSNAGLEAMERGLVPIISDCGGLDTYVDSQTGWVIPRDDAPALAQAMAEALSLSRDQIQAMGMRARMLVEHKFDIAKVAERYLNLFTKLQLNA